MTMPAPDLLQVAGSSFTRGIATRDIGVLGVEDPVDLEDDEASTILLACQRPCRRAGAGGRRGGVRNRSPPARMWSITAASVRPSALHQSFRPSVLLRAGGGPVPS